jgi:hypothetical protein
MPKGPNGERRPADTNARAVMVGKIATGELVEDLPAMSGRQRSGQAGGKARATALSESERRKIAEKAATIRWEKGKEANMNITVKQRLADLYKRKRESGLIDTKYFLQNVQGVPDEVVYAEALRFDEAVERGDTVALVFNDSRVAK